MKCMPYASHYTDCTDANTCSGCNRCNCNGEGKWECQKVVICPQGDETSFVDEEDLENALDVLLTESEEKPKRGPGSLVPAPPSPDDDLLLVPDMRKKVEEEMRLHMGRLKRAVSDENHNATIKFYETIDEINEDTLKNLNSSGTIEAHKVHPEDIGKISRRTNILDGNNASNDSDLQIKYNQAHKLEHHIAENKIDSQHPTEEKINGLSHEEIHKILGNYSQIVKNKELSKLVVNELKRGSERIGDKNVVPVSNITFTPENDTLTALTFIAGNLLNKLWDMEKDASEGSFETETMKHDKINDLLELFKEPLSLRQESFLKNALEKLSLVIDGNKNSKNMSLCAKIDDPETITTESNNCTDKSNIQSENNSPRKNIKMQGPHFQEKSKATTNALNKINDVLNLIKKYEDIQQKLKNLDSFPEPMYKSTVAVNDNMSIDEKVSLNLFGTLLEKITKLLSPNNNGKRMTKKIQTYNMLRNDDVAKRNIEKLFNINLGNISMGTKDKMITDYLSNIEKHPKCFFTHLQRSAVTPFSNIEGNILYNLSEFFKIKSFDDLLKTVNDKSDATKIHSTTRPTTTNYSATTKQSPNTDTILRSSSKNQTGNLESVKEKLKSDIKMILQDLFELQKEHGIKTKSNINIADALPCIYNILKTETDVPRDNSKSKITPISKISSFIDSLKLDMKLMSSRRSNMNIIPRPKSAIVWERAIKNLNKKHEKASRRYLGENPKTYKELKDMMEKVELSGKTYKNFAIHVGVAPSEKLILLKTLLADNIQYTDVLQAIQKSLPTIINLSPEQQNEFTEFVDNAALNINLSNKLFDLVTNFKETVLDVANTKSKARMITESNQPLIMIPKWVDSNENNKFKLKRDQIMNQLIMNRLKLYIKAKERTENDLNMNANYNIARRILFHLENGNIALAKELYKVFLANKQQQPAHKFSEYQEKELFHDNRKAESKGPRILAFKEPLVRVEEPKVLKMLNQDYFLKQLWNLKDLKE